MNKRIAIYGGSFNPPGNHHIQIAITLAKMFDSVIIAPCGKRIDKGSANILSLKYRKELVQIAFKNLSKVKVDYDDLDQNIYTPTYFLQKKYEKLYPDTEIWHVAGTDIIKDGSNSNSEIHRVWQYGEKIWQTLNWVIIYRPGHEIVKNDMPPSSMLIKILNLFSSGTMIRKRSAKDKCITDLATPEMIEYIRKYKLYKKIKEVK
ncbi:nicotinate-nicotinamide nucleotide adenylyltransferase [Patescibacteria group bacterium]|nr:nicotinate-nicotinamide nucleotide adenylyltransferase [Patescibacteria group bacterium]